VPSVPPESPTERIGAACAADAVANIPAAASARMLLDTNFTGVPPVDLVLGAAGYGASGVTVPSQLQTIVNSVVGGRVD
jgi:hypothetical protein